MSRKKKKPGKNTPNKHYAKRIPDIINKALDQYPRLLALRVDDEERRVDCLTSYSDVITHFISSSRWMQSEVEN